MKEINKEPLPKGGNLTDDIIEVELLAPARNAEVAVAAINHGADAVYMGASSHGARQQASNSISDIRGVVEYAHRFGVKVYVPSIRLSTMRSWPVSKNLSGNFTA